MEVQVQVVETTRRARAGRGLCVPVGGGTDIYRKRCGEETRSFFSYAVVLRSTS